MANRNKNAKYHMLDDDIVDFQDVERDVKHMGRIDESRYNSKKKDIRNKRKEKQASRY